MVLFWGNEHTCFCNEAYRPALRSGTLDSIMGKEAGVALPEIWPLIRQDVQRVFSEGVSAQRSDHLIPLFREGLAQEVYWSHTYAPVLDDNGDIGGVLITCTETTARVLAERRLQESEHQLSRSLASLITKQNLIYDARKKFEAVFEGSPAFLAVLSGPDLVFERVNRRYRELVGPRDLIGRAFLEAIPEVGNQDFFRRLQEVLVTGKSYFVEELPVKLKRGGEPGSGQRFVDLVYEQMRDGDGRPVGVFSHGIDVTEKVLARKRVEESEERLQMALDSAQMGTWFIDLDTREITVSRHIAMMLGMKDMTSDNILKTNRQVIHPEDLAETQRRWTEAVISGRPYRHEYRIVRPSGEVRWLYSAGKASCDPNGRPLSLAGVTVDVTDRKEVQARISESESRIRAFAEVMPQMAFVADGSGSIVYYNQRFYAYTGLLKGEAEGWSWKEASIHHPEDIERTLITWDRCVRTGEPYNIEYRLRRHDGQYRWHLGRAEAVRDKDGRITQWYGTNTDIHDQKMLEVEMRHAKSQAEAANAAKSAFLANMSHEIRTPLGAILGFTEMLRDAVSSSERSDYAKIIKRNGQALSRIIDDILDLSKVEAGRLETERVVFRIDELVQDISEMFHENAKNKGIQLRVEFAPQTPREIKSDPTRLRQILINLVGNAIKFTESGFIELLVEPIFQAGTLVQMKFTVRDTGVGMTESQMQRLFEPFSQADNSTTRKFGGSGLGLALSRKLARALGGDITIAHSRLGEGSSFVVVVEAQVILHEEHPPLTQISEEFHVATHDAHPSRVLLVEDSIDNQTLVSLILRKAGIAIDVANNGAEGVHMAQHGHYDVVLMDMQMPVLDGYAAARQLRRSGFRSPIVALTAHAMAEERSKIFAAGCDAHLTKPVDSDLLVKTIQSYGH